MVQRKECSSSKVVGKAFYNNSKEPTSRTTFTPLAETVSKGLLSPMLSMDDEGNDGIEVLSINSSSCGGGNIQWHSLKDATGIELCLESPPNHDDVWQGHAVS
jgi:hypothetical protein